MVRLRAYQWDGMEKDVPFVAPTINLHPGETFRLTLDNQLPSFDPSCADVHKINIPHCFNSTNMHTYGLWVNPAGNSDNVLIRIKPGVKFTYEYNIPADHPAGTFWYHPHRHGSTALQVSSGMAGALIIRGDRLPALESPGDIDTLLRDPDGTPFPERVILLQQIPYACRDRDNGPIKTDKDGRWWTCDDDGDVGTIERYAGPSGPDQFGPRAWRESGRYTSINGWVVPTFKATAGRIERWRLIHAGVRDTIKLTFKKSLTSDRSVASATAYTAATPQARAAYVDAHCADTPLSQTSIATDGLTRPTLRQQTTSWLQPGYRDDLLMVFPEPGVYCLVDEAASSAQAIDQQSNSRQLLGFVKVSAGEEASGSPLAASSKIGSSPRRGNSCQAR